MCVCVCVCVCMCVCYILYLSIYCIYLFIKINYYYTPLTGLAIGGALDSVGDTMFGSKLFTKVIPVSLQWDPSVNYRQSLTYLHTKSRYKNYNLVIRIIISL